MTTKMNLLKGFMDEQPFFEMAELFHPRLFNKPENCTASSR